MKPVARFEGRVLLEKLPGSRDWRVAAGFLFVSSTGLVVEVPSGFVTDGASIPRVMWWLFPPAGGYMNAAVVHDACYRLHKTNRAEADWILYEAMGVLGCWWVTRAVFWLALRGFGWWAWVKD